MANFCTKCGTPLNAENGLCPVCDSVNVSFSSVETTESSENIDPHTGNCCVTAGEIKKQNKGNKTITTILTVLLSICLFFSLLFALTIYTIRGAFDEDSMEELFENVEPTEFLYDTGLASNKDFEKFFTSMYNLCGVEMTERQLDRFIERSTVKEFFVSKIEDFSDDFFEGDAELTIEKDEIVTLIRRNTNEFEKEFGVELTSSQIFELADWFCEGDEITVISSDMLEEDYSDSYYIISVLLSYFVMFVFVVISLLLIILMIKNSLLQALCGIGINFIIFGSIFGFFAILVEWIAPLWKNIAGGSIAYRIIGVFAVENLLLCIISIILGFGLLLTRKILKNKMAKNA